MSTDHSTRWFWVGTAFSSAILGCLSYFVVWVVLPGYHISVNGIIRGISLIFPALSSYWLLHLLLKDWDDPEVPVSSGGDESSSSGGERGSG